MNITNRITVNKEELFKHLESKLDRLQLFRYDAKYRMLLGSGMIDKLDEWDKKIRAQKDEPITLVVCGEFKRGKSSLINAILGENVVTTNVTTETITVNRVCYGEHSNAIILSGGKRVILTDDELRSENLKEILASVSENDKVMMLELKRPIEILKNITIIDTPGLGDAMKDFTAEVEYALAQADAVMYVFSAFYPISMQEQFFIKTAIKPQKYTELFLVSNYCDMIEDEDGYNRLENAIKERISLVLPDEETLMISALDERCRQLGKASPNEALSDKLSENFGSLRARLDELISEKKEIVITDRVERLINAMIRDLEADINAINSGLILNAEEISLKREETERIKKEKAAEQETVLAEIDKKAENFKGIAVGWMEEFVDCMEHDVNNVEKVDVEDIKKYYSIFCVDTMQKAIDRCNDYFIEAIYEEVENISLSLAKKLSMSEEEKSVSFKFAVNNRTWTSGDNIAFIGSRVSGITGMLMTFGASFMREHELKKTAPDVIKNIRAQYSELRMAVIPAINENYSKISDNVKKQLMEYFDMKSAELEEQMLRSEEVSRRDESQKQEIKSAIEEITKVLENIKQEFGA